MEQYEYAVRGASIFCDQCTHIRKLNLPMSHGAYVNSKPMMNELDCKLEDNISTFGICHHPANTSSETVYLISMEGVQIEGKPCQPVLLGDKWLRTKTATKVDGHAALTTESQLICGIGGIIQFYSSGQHED